MAVSIGGAFAGARETYMLDGWGHSAPDVLSASVVAAVILGLWPPAGLMLLAVAFALVTVVILTWLVLRRHDRRLCERCVAALPLNPSARATAYRRRFMIAHLASRPPLVLVYLGLLVGTNFLPGIIGHAVWAAAQLSMIYLLRSYVSHRRLQPWCPRCSEPGDDERVEDPTPPRGRTRELV